MKLIVQIPCLNEEKTLPLTVQEIPRVIDGIDKIEILVVDDGSTDRTYEVAKECGANHVIRNIKTVGLARSFATGIDGCLKRGADIIVNTDGDNQYPGADIPKLIKPILTDEADMVIGVRDIDSITHFSFIKKQLQKLGSWVVQKASGTNISDVTSGFRAFNRDVALRMNVTSGFSYTLESIIQAGNRRFALQHVPIGTNAQLRRPRLFKNTLHYLRLSIPIIIRIYTMYQPLKVFAFIGTITFFLGFSISMRFLYFFIQGYGGRIQSLILSAILIIMSFQFVMIGLLSDLIAGNRKLIEDTLYRVKKLDIAQSDGKSDHMSEQ